MKEKLWRAIEAYRMAGGREEHWRNRDALDQMIDEVVADAEQWRKNKASKDAMKKWLEGAAQCRQEKHHD